MNPRISVIVPAHQAAAVLPLSLSALERSTLPREQWELVVVDDASTDATSMAAARYADTLVRLAGQPHGPAYARNRGAEVSRGEILVFVDADVCVHADTLEKLTAVLDARRDVTALFGAYDTTPSHKGVVSEFRNLLHHYVHQRDAGDAETFWSGIGAIRAAVFFEIGMFDEWHYARPQIEDIELGRRLRVAGHRILLSPDIQGTHLKRWTLEDVLRTDVQHRGVPWTRLLLQEGPNGSSATLNLRRSEKFCTAAAGIAVAGLVAALVSWRPEPLLAPLLALVLIVALNRGFYALILRERGLRFAAAVLPLHFVFYSLNVASAIYGWLLHMLLGEPPAPVTVAAAAGMDLDIWPPAPARPSGGIWDITPEIPARAAPAAGSESLRRTDPRSVPVA